MAFHCLLSVWGASSRFPFFRLLLTLPKIQKCIYPAIPLEWPPSPPVRGTVQDREMGGVQMCVSVFVCVYECRCVLPASEAAGGPFLCLLLRPYKLCVRRRFSSPKRCELKQTCTRAQDAPGKCRKRTKAPSWGARRLSTDFGFLV